ncbi:MAG TPA: hypothetical protein VLH19_03055 [Patescibacteria group bacterium]|nr:hypothetical protein [Patescibacteria group bacterium]
MELMTHQLNASRQLESGKILYGAVGIGKSATVLDYYTREESPRDIYVITTAKKRDSGDWEREAAQFGIGRERSCTTHGTITVDSWNNIGQYRDVVNAFFVFDEQRVVGHGVWVRRFITIARANHWVLLSATPGDTWLDYGPVFVANGFYKNLTEFKRAHVIYRAYVHYPVVEGYINETKLELLRNHILVEMPYLRLSKQHLNYIDVGYNHQEAQRIRRDRWNTVEQRPIRDAAEMWRLLRRVNNSDPSRLEAVRFLMKAHPRLIIFYNFNYELEILRSLKDEIEVAEWNGHKHELVPLTDRWVYLVQYVSGAEGWNCTSTDAMILYSLTYSFKNFEQARGRIDRLDSTFMDLYYYIFVSNLEVDVAVRKSLGQKQSFNERKYLKEKVGKNEGILEGISAN